MIYSGAEIAVDLFKVAVDVSKVAVVNAEIAVGEISPPTPPSLKAIHQNLAHPYRSSLLSLSSQPQPPKPLTP